MSPADLSAVPKGAITEDGLKLNINVGIQYLESWLMGNGCVPIYNLMEERRHRGNFAHTGLAMAASRATSRMAARSRRT